MTVPNEYFLLWEEFLKKHAVIELINPDIGLPFNKAKAFKVSAKTLLHREFFKHLGHFMDEDLKAFLIHPLERSQIGQVACQRYRCISLKRSTQVTMQNLSG
jgi:hypothetical protein